MFWCQNCEWSIFTFIFYLIDQKFFILVMVEPHPVPHPKMCQCIRQNTTKSTTGSSFNVSMLVDITICCISLISIPFLGWMRWFHHQRSRNISTIFRDIETRDNWITRSYRLDRKITALKSHQLSDCYYRLFVAVIWREVKEWRKQRQQENDFKRLRASIHLFWSWG